MKPTKTSVSFGKTVNTGNFNSLRFDASMEIDMEPGDTATEAYTKAFAQVKATAAAEASK